MLCLQVVPLTPILARVDQPADNRHFDEPVLAGPVNDAPLRRGRVQAMGHYWPQSLVACRLCGNRILGSRDINLRNHARRHSSIKQFKCRYCQYEHSEISKVRLHMARKHDDPSSRPVNNANPEMKEEWKALAYRCFPHYFAHHPSYDLL